MTDQTAIEKAFFELIMTAETVRDIPSEFERAVFIQNEVHALIANSVMPQTVANLLKKLELEAEADLAQMLESRAAEYDQYQLETAIQAAMDELKAS